METKFDKLVQRKHYLEKEIQIAIKAKEKAETIDKELFHKYWTRQSLLEAELRLINYELTNQKEYKND